MKKIIIFLLIFFSGFNFVFAKEDVQLDRTAPIVSNIHFENRTFSWETDEPCSTWFLYGKIGSDNMFEVNNDVFDMYHVIKLPDNLEAEAVYSSVIRATDETGNWAERTGTFKIKKQVTSIEQKEEGRSLLELTRRELIILLLQLLLKG